ncbi:MAG: GNAT family N-acetyltransferase [Thermoleophilaceae bacterium]|nr:GNAT family N-acetyltransferase [Thermoleophilaceae bacterium]
MAHRIGDRPAAKTNGTGSAVRAEPRPGRCVVAAGDPRGDREEILRLAGHLPDSPGAERFAKYYDRSPYGPPSVVLAREPGSDRAVGMAALMPTRLRVGGQPVPAAISGDFSIDPEYRGFGPALALQRASLKTLPERGWMCAFGCPNELSEPIVKRVGFEETGPLTRYVKVLRTQLLVGAYVRRPRLRRMLSAAGHVTADPVLRAVSRERRGRLALERPAMFDERFAEVFEATARAHALTGERSAEVLNWKYELDTGRPSPYSILAAVEGDGRVAGYVVYRVKDGVWHLFDLATLGPTQAIDALLSGVVGAARQEGALGVGLLCLGSLGPLGRRLRSFGFLPRVEDKRLRVYLPERPAGADPLRPDNWYFVMGDDDF